MSGLVVRASTEADVARCAEIYGHHVLHGTASFEVDPPDLAEMKKRRAAVLDLGLPHLVAERDGRVMGYAYAGNWRPRPAYKFSVEDSIYIDKDAVGQGVGKALLPVLIEQCTALGKKQMVAVIGEFGLDAVDPAPRLLRLRDGRHAGEYRLQVRPLARQRADAAGAWPWRAPPVAGARANNRLVI